MYCDHQLIAAHRRTDKIGHFHTQAEHLPAHKNLRQEGFQRLLLAKAGYIGQSALRWSQEVLQEKGPLAFRLIQGMLSLTRSFPKEQVDGVCKTTLAKGVFKLRILKRLLEQPDSQPEQHQLMQEHELIRPLSQYAQLTLLQEEYQ